MIHSHTGSWDISGDLRPAMKGRGKDVETKKNYPLSLHFSVAALPSADPCAQHPPLLRCSTRPAPESQDKMQRGLQKCWGSAQRWLTSISAAIITSEQLGQRGLQECWNSAVSWCTSMSAAIASMQEGQRSLQECWGSVGGVRLGASLRAKELAQLLRRYLITIEAMLKRYKGAIKALLILRECMMNTKHILSLWEIMY